MKIYCTQFNNPQAELDYYIKKICNKDIWLGVRQEDLYNKWIKASDESGQLLFASVYNSAYYSKEDFYNEVNVIDMTADEIKLNLCEVIHPIHALPTEELVEYVSTGDRGYRFD